VYLQIAPLEHQLRTLQLKPTDAIGSSYSEESRQEIADSVVIASVLLVWRFSALWLVESGILNPG
jgi:hypothetical protein